MVDARSYAVALLRVAGDVDRNGEDVSVLAGLINECPLEELPVVVLRLLGIILGLVNGLEATEGIETEGFDLWLEGLGRRAAAAGS